MPFFDRFWRLRLLIALCVLLCAVAVPVRYLVVLYTLRRSDRPDVIDFICAGGLLLALTVVAGWLGKSAPRACTRQECRLAALAGDQDTMPRLYMADNVSDDLARQDHLFIYWRSPWYHRFITSVIYGVFALPFIGFLSLFILGFFVALLPINSRPLAEVFVWFRPPVMLFLLFAVYFFCMVTYVALTSLAGRSAGVEVTTDGLIARRYWGRTVFIPWKDARLLEVSGTWLDPEFRLYSPHAVARWRNQTLSFPMHYPSRIPVFRPLGSQGDDVLAHFEAICAAIRSHSGLVPRSLSRNLINWYGHSRSRPKAHRGWKRQTARQL